MRWRRGAANEERPTEKADSRRFWRSPMSFRGDERPVDLASHRRSASRHAAWAKGAIQRNGICAERSVTNPVRYLSEILPDLLRVILHDLLTRRQERWRSRCDYACRRRRDDQESKYSLLKH
jgi:hypothetical protein